MDFIRYFQLVLCFGTIVGFGFFGSGLTAAEGDRCPQSLSRTAIINSMESIFRSARGVSPEVREDAANFIVILRTLGDKVSDATVRKIRDGVREQNWDMGALLSLKEYETVRALAKLEGIKIPLSTPPHFEALAEVQSTFNHLLEVEALSDGGEYLFLGSHHGLDILNPHTKTKISELANPPQDSEPLAAEFIQGGAKIVVTFRGYVGYGIWDSKSGKLLSSTFSVKSSIGLQVGVPESADLLAISSDGGRLATASMTSGQIHLWMPGDHNPELSAKTLNFSKDIGAILQLQFSHEGKSLLVVAGHPQKIFSWDLTKNVLKTKFPTTDTGFYQARVNETEGFVVATAHQEGTVQVWDAEGKPVRQFKTGIDHLLLSQDGKLLVGVRPIKDGTDHVELWSTLTGQLVFSSAMAGGTMVGGTVYRGQASFSADSKFFTVKSFLKDGDLKHEIRVFGIEGDLPKEAEAPPAEWHESDNGEKWSPDQP